MGTIMPEDKSLHLRRSALKCMAYSGAGCHIAYSIHPRMVATIVVE